MSDLAVLIAKHVIKLQVFFSDLKGKRRKVLRAGNGLALERTE